MDFLKAHDVIDEAERKIYEDTGILMTLHLDPIKLNDPEVKAYQDEVNKSNPQQLFGELIALFFKYILKIQ